MAGKFTNTQYTNIVDSMTSTIKSTINNPFYLYSDKKSTKTDYYNLNTTRTTLDEAAHIQYSSYEGNSPMKYNVIRDFLIFGIGNSFEINYDNGDYGIEATPFEGEAFIMPNTIIPYPGDMFVITYLKEQIIFRVNEVQKDTLDTGSNAYKISYKTHTTEAIGELEEQVVKEYKFIAKNVGTNFSCLLEAGDFGIIGNLENTIINLANYYKELFFDEKVQTFVFSHNEELHYDPYMIEFCIRNNIFAYGDEYLYITHQAVTPKTFSINYAKTIFNSIEEKKTNKFSTRIFADARAICDVCSLFWMRSNTYFQLDYNTGNMNPNKVQIIDSDIISHIKNHKYFEATENNYGWNLLIAYLYDDSEYIKSNVDSIIEGLNYKENIEYFYLIPVIIYVLMNFINGLMS